MTDPIPAADEPREKYDWKFRLLLAVVPWLFCFLTYPIFWTYRVTVFGKEHDDRFRSKGESILFVTWHQGFFYFIYHFRHRDGVAMVSRSKDGELGTRVINKFGFRAARGSSSRGGKQALQVMAEDIINNKSSAGIVPDGPRGPACKAKIGSIKLAKETGAPIIPVMWWAKSKILLKSWDRTILPRPFTRIALFYDPPMFVAPDATNEQMEEARVELERRLNRMQATAREHFGES
jgi:lysophospholipid acyltransferase (LPLAT)-like uncharacterized protein